jgi:hypothetical protein
MDESEDWKKERTCGTGGCTHAATTGLSLCVRCRALGMLAGSQLVDERLLADAQAKLKIERAPAIERAVQEAFVAIGRVRVAVLAALDAPTVTSPEGDGVVRTFWRAPKESPDA